MLAVYMTDQYNEVTEEDGTIRKVKKTEAELELLKKYYYKDGVLTMNSMTQEMFTPTEPFSFSESEVHIRELTVDGINAVIDIGDSDQVVRADRVNLQNGATLTIKGAGSFKLYAKNFGMTNGEITAADKASIETYLDGKEAITFDDTFKSPGLLYVRAAHVTLPATGGFEGNIITGAKRLTLNGVVNNTKQLILAPKATVSLKNDTVFNGAIIAKNVYMEEATLIFAKPEDQIPIPLAVEQFDTPIQLVQVGNVATK